MFTYSNSKVLQLVLRETQVSLVQLTLISLFFTKNHVIVTQTAHLCNFNIHVTKCGPRK